MSCTTETYQELPSMRDQIDCLGIDETFSRATRFDGEFAVKSLIDLESRRLRDAIVPTLSRISKRTGKRFKVEQGTFRTMSHDVVIVVAVTREA